MRIPGAGAGGGRWAFAGAYTRQTVVCKKGGVMLALIFGVQAAGLLFALRQRPGAAVGCFWLGMLLAGGWFGHHATQALGLTF